MHLKGIGKDDRFGEMVGVSGQSRTGVYRHRDMNISPSIHNQLRCWLLQLHDYQGRFDHAQLGLSE